MLKKTPKDIRREESQALLKDLLAGKYLTLSIGALSIDEQVATGETQVRCELSIANIEGVLDNYNVVGAGMGFIDALFNGVCDKIVDDCQTFDNLSIQEFHVEVDKNELREAKRRGVQGSAANVDICLILHNGYLTKSSAYMPFRSRSRSLVSAGVQVVMQAVEFYVNSEKAVMELRSLINNAKERNRIDLVERYISMLSTLTENTSYEGI